MKQSMRRRFSIRDLLWLTVPVAMGVGCILLLARSAATARGPANRGNYDKIKIGMTEVEVESLLGAPGEELAPLTYQDIRADEPREVLLQSASHALRHWVGDSHMITVIFDPQRKVVGKSYLHDQNVGPLRRIVDWLGF
jgi:hypothetical protein